MLVLVGVVLGLVLVPILPLLQTRRHSILAWIGAATKHAAPHRLDRVARAEA